jgi:hypothetical protein
MNNVPAVIYVWLYLAGGTNQGAEVGGGALATLADALSIPSEHVFAGDDLGSNHRSHYSQASRLLHFPLQGDFTHSCDIQLSGWALSHVEASLIKLSISGLSVAMIDETDASPFACILFRAGSRLKVTVVVNDETNEATIYPVQSAGR